MENTVDLYANGKLLLTGEYLVLQGARALAWPVRYGQSLSVKPINQAYIEWTSRDANETWLSAKISLPDLEIISENIGNIAFAQKLLQAIHVINPAFFERNKGFQFNFRLNYPREWGLGSSSTLISLVSRLTDTEVYEVFHKISRGSGYDVACASRHQPFFFTKSDPIPFIEEAIPGKALKGNAVFAWLGNKQETQPEVDRYIKDIVISDKYTEKINRLGQEICYEDEPNNLCTLVREHEDILSEILRKDPVSLRFPGFPGAVKSLGAWGGDFVMFVSTLPNLKIKEIIREYGLQTMFTFDELSILS